ncbi:amidohydrolase family protein [Streptomyces sp. CT34]|uniref:amidohydrolase family protein n=1 Tax=Streptomyces sp. CT34 TaxID=1553907 RepID=UPI00068A1487|nr:amidohydrolase family protein [Streptomyces sp. CT34]
MAYSLKGVVDGIIDAHVHQWDPFTTPRQASPAAPVYRAAPRLVEAAFAKVAPTTIRELTLTPRYVAQPFLPGDYAAAAKGVAEAVGAPVTALVHIEAGWQEKKDPMAPVEETKWLISLPWGRDGRPDLAAIVAHADPTSPHCAALIDAHLQASGKVTCIRQLAAWHPDPKVLNWYDKPGLLKRRDFLTGFSAVAERGLTFEATIYSDQLPDVAVLAREYPETTIIIDHYATPVGVFGPVGTDTGATAAKRAEIYRAWKDHISAVAEHSNVVAKHSGCAFPQLGFGHSPECNIGGRDNLQQLLQPMVDHVTDAFGPDRVLFGSNYPMDRPNASLPDIIGMLVNVLGPRGNDVLRKVFRDNATRVYGIDAHTAKNVAGTPSASRG